MLIKNVKFEPLSQMDWQKISPPNYSTIFFEICKPKPIPFVLISFVESKKPNNLNNFS
jgi:hypothetical protein